MMMKLRGTKKWWVLSAGLVLALGTALAVGLAASRPEEAADAANPPAGGQIERLLLGVEGVSCGSCEVRIRETLEARAGVRAVAVDLGQRTVTVEYAAGSDDPKSLAEAITRLGYPARFLAAGPGVLPARPGATRPGGGCGGNCCAGG